MSGEATAAMQKSNKTQKAESFMLENLVPGVTSLLKAGKSDYIQAASNIIQRSMIDGFWQALCTEWHEWVKQGKIKQSYVETQQAKECLSEMLDSSANDKPDKKRFKVMKNIFLQAASAPEEEWQKNDPQQLMKVCRKLTAEEFIILGVAYRQYSSLDQGEREQASRAAENWPSVIASSSNGMISEGVVDFFEDDLIRKKLIGERVHNDRSGVRYAHNFRLAPLGLELGKFLIE